MGVAASCVMRRALCAARHREIGGERDLAAVPAVDFRNGADHHAGVEHLVVEREIVGRDDGDAELVLARPVGGAKPGAGLDAAAFSSVLPDQKLSSANFSSRRGPMRGVPSEATGVTEFVEDAVEAVMA